MTHKRVYLHEETSEEESYSIAIYDTGGSLGFSVGVNLNGVERRRTGFISFEEAKRGSVNILANMRHEQSLKKPVFAELDKLIDEYSEIIAFLEVNNFSHYSALIEKHRAQSVLENLKQIKKELE